MPGKTNSKVSTLWESIANFNPGYKVTVLRTAPYKGMLIIAYEGKVFYTKPVGLSFDGQFGIPFEDLKSWWKLSDEVVIAHESLQGIKR